jgi:hypothetical protein
MHIYSYSGRVESDERIAVAHRIAWMALAISAIIYFLFVHFGERLLPKDQNGVLQRDGVFIGFLLTSPSALGLFHFLYARISASWWKVPFWRFALGISVPNLNGRWVGECVTHYPDGSMKTSKDIELTVLQDWRTICIGINGLLHKSDSVGAGIRRVSDGWIINYQYIAIRKLKSPNKENINVSPLEKDSEHQVAEGGDPLRHQTHVGAARLFIPDDHDGDATRTRVQRETTAERINPEKIKLQFFTEHLRIGHMWFSRPEETGTMNRERTTREESPTHRQ